MAAIIDLTEMPSPQPPEVPLIGFGHSVSGPDHEDEGAQYVRSANSPLMGEYIRDKRWIVGRSKHQSSTRSKWSGPSPKTPIAGLEIIRRSANPGFYHTLLKPGFRIGMKSVLPIAKPDIFKGLRLSPNREIAVGDIDYSKNRAVKPNANAPGSGLSGTLLEGCSTDAYEKIETTLAPVKVVSNTSMPFGDLEVSETSASLYPELGTSRTFNHPESTNTPPGPSPKLYPSLRSLSEPPMCDFGQYPNPNEAVSERNASLQEQHRFLSKRTGRRHNYKKLRNEFLDFREYAMGFEKDMQNLESRVLFLETKEGIGGLPKKLRKKRRLLLGAGDAHTARVIQHINHLIELRAFMEKLKEK